MAVIFNVPQKIGDPTGQGLNLSQITNEINSAVSLSLLNLGEAALLSAVYGRGIGKAIASEKQMQANKSNSNPFSISNSSLFPDAAPDGIGGFSKTVNWGGYMSSSLSGMPVMCRLKFVGTTYIGIDGITVTVPDIIFESVLITLKQNKNIKKTKIFGRRKQGTVKEDNGNGDWSVDIRAIITFSQPLNDQIYSSNQDGIYPIENMQALAALLDANVAIQVECWYLNKIAGINWLVIDDGAEIAQIEGEYEAQRVNLPCISDNPLIITISQPQ